MLSVRKSGIIFSALLVFLAISILYAPQSRAFERSIPWPSGNRGFEYLAGDTFSDTIEGATVLSEIEIQWLPPEDDSNPRLTLRMVSSVSDIPDGFISGRVAPLAGLIRIMLPAEASISYPDTQLLAWTGTSWDPVSNALLDPELESQLAQAIGSSVLRSGGMLSLDAFTITSSYARNLTENLTLNEPAVLDDSPKNQSFAQILDFYWLDPADSEGIPLINRTVPSQSAVREIPIELDIEFTEIHSCQLSVYVGFIEALCLENPPGRRGQRESTIIYNYRSFQETIDISLSEPSLEELEALLVESGQLAEPEPLEPVNMVLIPAGTYTIGADDDGAGGMERPPYLVELEEFFIDVFPVTNVQFWNFSAESNYQTDSDWQRFYTPGADNYPVRSVTYYDALAYANWYGKRLPTEQEWEAAARGSEGNIYPWGNEWRPDIVAERIFMPVDSHPDNISPFGVREMCGNVFEWTSSQLLPYPGNTYPNIPEWLVLRGGAATNRRPILFRTTTRPASQPYVALHTFGFRCAMDVDAWQAQLEEQQLEIPEAVPVPAEEEEPAVTTLIGGEDGVVEFVDSDDDEQAEPDKEDDESSDSEDETTEDDSSDDDESGADEDDSEEPGEDEKPNGDEPDKPHPAG